MKKMKEMKEKIAKILIAFTIIGIIVITYGSTICLAEETEETGETEGLSITSILSRGNDFIKTGKEQQKDELTDEKILIDFLPIGKVLVAVATATVFIVVIIMGIKWVTASPDQQATLKKQLLGLVVAIIVIYGAVGIWTLVNTIMNSLTE